MWIFSFSAMQTKFWRMIIAIVSLVFWWKNRRFHFIHSIETHLRFWWGISITFIDLYDFNGHWVVYKSGIFYFSGKYSNCDWCCEYVEIAKIRNRFTFTRFGCGLELKKKNFTHVNCPQSLVLVNLGSIITSWFINTPKYESLQPLSLGTC